MLIDANTHEDIRPETLEERALSEAKYYGHPRDGIITVDGREVYVVPDDRSPCDGEP